MRVVVTGMGIVSPLGYGIDPTWEALIAGRSGISRITSFEVDSYPSQIAGQIPENEAEFSALISSKDQKKMGRFIQLSLIAADQALKDARWAPPARSPESTRTGVLVGSGIGGLPEIEQSALKLAQGGPRHVSPFFVPSSLINLATGHISIRYGFSGPNFSIVSACSSGAHAIGESFRIIQRGEADVMVAGGTEAAICPLGIAGFSSMKALSTGFNDFPEQASRPWDKRRDGFVIGEGAGIMILESLEHAQRRGAHIHGEIVGYGLSGDAYHISAPLEDGQGAYTAMSLALQEASVSPSSIGYINAHATSTPQGDGAELTAIERLFSSTGVKISSTKSAIGHLLGAAGSVEAIFTLLALKTNKLPPTLNLEESEITTSLDLIAQKAQVAPAALQYALSNSFGFGGTNASLIFKKWT